MACVSGTEHPYNEKYIIPSDTKVLIVGTAPPPRFCKRPWSCEDDLDFDFFYGSGSNWMWGILPHALNESDALPETLPAEQCEIEAANFLRRHRLWMRDVLACIKRKAGKENSAKDSDIENPNDEDFADFKKAFECAPSLCAIATTSEVAFKWLMQALKLQKLTSTAGTTELSTWRTFHSTSHAPNSTEFLVEKHSRPVTAINLREGNRTVCIYILPSPSSGRAGVTIDSKRQVYRRILGLGGVN